MGKSYGAYCYLIGAALAVNLIGVVLFRTVAGAMLPLALRLAASVLFVAPLADVMGALTSVTMASVLLRGMLS